MTLDGLEKQLVSITEDASATARKLRLAEVEAKVDQAEGGEEAVTVLRTRLRELAAARAEVARRMAVAQEDLQRLTSSRGSISLQPAA